MATIRSAPAMRTLPYAAHGRAMFRIYFLMVGSIALTAHVLPGFLQPYAYSVILAGMVYLPITRLDKERIPLADVGLHLKGFWREALFAAKWVAGIFIPFILVNHWWHVEVFKRRFFWAWPKDSFDWLVQWNDVLQTVGLDKLGQESLVWLGPLSILWVLVQQALFIGLPEEWFYRGYMQNVFRDRYGDGFFRLFGVPIGRAVLFTSLLFAAGHLAAIPHPFRLAVFFPSLLFGWMALRRGSLVSAILFHGAANTLTTFVNACYH